MALEKSGHRQPSSFEGFNKYFTAAQNIAVILGLVLTVLTLDQLVEQTKLQNQSLSQTEEVNSANYALGMENRLESPKFDPIYETLEYSNKNTILLNTEGGPYSRAYIEEYIDNLDDIGMLVKDGVILQQSAFDDFSDPVEYAWCNNDVQKVIAMNRSEDQSATKLTDPYYSNFEYVANLFLQKDGGC